MGFNSYEKSETPRNLFAFKDGTINPAKNELDKVVWIKDGSWLDNGTYLAIRRVQMHLETWDRTHLKGQNDTFGRKRLVQLMAKIPNLKRRILRQKMKRVSALCQRIRISFWLKRQESRFCAAPFRLQVA